MKNLSLSLRGATATKQSIDSNRKSALRLPRPLRGLAMTHKIATRFVIAMGIITAMEF